MLSPPGDQCGNHEPGPIVEVNCVGLEPSLSHTQISNLPDRVDLNAIRLPSGEYCGSSSVFVDEMRLNGRTGLPWRFA